MVQLPAENSILAAAVRRAADEHRLSHAVILTGRGDLTAAEKVDVVLKDNNSSCVHELIERYVL